MERQGRRSYTEAYDQHRHSQHSTPVKTNKTASAPGEEVMIKYTVQCLNKGYNNTDNMDTIRVRKVHIWSGTAWSTLEKELKKECSYASIRKIKYTDKDGDNIYVVDSAELEAAIFKEGILKFDVMFFKHEIIYTVQYVSAANPEEPSQDFGIRKAYPSIPNAYLNEPFTEERAGGMSRRKSVRKSTLPSDSVWDLFLHTIQRTCKNAVIQKIKYLDHYDNDICIVQKEELEKAIFNEGSYKFHVLIEIEIIYTAQHLDAKKPDKADKNIGIRKAYPLPSSSSDSSTSAWNIVSSTIRQMYNTAEVKKVKYTDKSGNDVYLVNQEEMEKAIFREGIGMFHVLFHCEQEVNR